MAFKITIFAFIMILLSSCGGKGGNSNEENSLEVIPSGCNPCRIFTTSAATSGQMGGVSGADQKCMTDANYPGSGNFKR